MSYKVVKKITITICGLAVTLVYFLRAWIKYPELFTAEAELSAWGRTFLWFMLVAIVSRIIMEIFSHMIYAAVHQEDEPDLMDERDKLIELRGLRISHWIFSIGFIAGMIALAAGAPAYIFFLILLAGGQVSELGDELSQAVMYHRGF